MPGIIIVKFVNHLPPDGLGKATGSPELDAKIRSHDVRHIARLAPTVEGPSKAGGADLSRVYTLHFETGEDAKEVARDFANSRHVEYAEPQFIYPLLVTPNDPEYNPQSTYYNKMQFPGAFDDTKGELGNVVVAIVDGGTQWSHSDLSANTWANIDENVDGIDTDNNGFIDDIRGWNFTNNSNDPTGVPATSASGYHGTHVAGIACAVTNNSLRVAGASWNSTYMPICAAHPTLSKTIAFGFQGIIYAVQNGADIINCSWGRAGNPSAFEQDVINFAHDNDVAIVAAAGNDNSNNNYDDFPSSYDHVLSVAAVDNNDVKAISSNYGVTVDVSAQGGFIRSTFPNNTTGVLSGTSMSSAFATAACALVKTKFPTYTADQVMQRVRVTADNIDGVNPSFFGLLGYGRINALRAVTVTTPAITIENAASSTSDGDSIIEPGETVTLDLTVKNHLDPATTCTFTLIEDSEFVTIVSGNAAVTSINTLQSVMLPSMTFNVSGGAPINHRITLTLYITVASPSYVDKGRFRLTVLPISATHNANQVVTTVTSLGKLGYGGIGFSFAGSPDLLFEGALMMGVSAAQVSDAARGNDGTTQDDDFVTATNGMPVITEPSGAFAELGVASFTDAAAANPLNLFVRQESWEHDTPPNDDFITIEYTIRNDGASAVNGLYVGWFFDWDIAGTSSLTDRTGYDATRGLSYVWDDGNGPNVYAGVKTLTPPGTTSARGIWNNPLAAGNPSWGTYDGYTAAEKWESLTAGVMFTDAGPEDVSNAIATGPFTIAQAESVFVAFAVLGGDDLADLQANADAAQNVYDAPVDTGERMPRRLDLSQNFPNPFNPSTTIAFELPRTSIVDLGVYGVDGRLVRRLEVGALEAGIHRVEWDGLNDAGKASPSGTYFYRLVVDGTGITRKMQLLK